MERRSAEGTSHEALEPHARHLRDDHRLEAGRDLPAGAGG
jgi:hypothetical protein